MLTLSEEQKFYLIFAKGSESFWERKYHGCLLYTSDAADE